jgi:hypothetical protein
MLNVHVRGDELTRIEPIQLTKEGLFYEPHQEGLSIRTKQYRGFTLQCLL